ncbi:MAG: DUF1501 domain-containing protein [Candidatus Kapabacteria bacterium]|jgi:uncharacterized protein (DUF1501 family)|nr:DUF1501 domain-containing protein [Candidatus Kapabacteria bacterium]
MKRRQFLQNSAAVTAGAVFAPYIMKGNQFKILRNEDINAIAEDNVLIIVELFGGNDGLNTIIPAYNDTYYNIRPTLNYPVENTKRFGTSDVYFNPSLVDDVHNGGLLRMMEDGRLAIVEGVGYKDPNLSHFRSEDIHLSGINSSDPKVKLLEGWLARYFHKKLPNFPLEIPEHPLSVQIGGSLSMLLKAKKGHMGISITDPEKFFELGAGLSPKEKMMPNDTNFGQEFNFNHVIAQQSEMYSKAVKEAFDKGKTMHKVDYSEGFAQQFKIISALIAGGLKTKVYFVKLSNFDSHAQQMNPDFTGQHPTLLKEMANGVSEFMDDAVQQGWSERVAGFTISEFGRRAYDNGSRGTDHGAASMQFVFGGEYVEGGYYGDKPKLEADDLDLDGNVVYQHEFRRTFTDVLTNWLGAETDDIIDLFGKEFMPIGVLKPRDCAVGDLLVSNNNNNLLVYPNPSAGNVTVSFELKEASNVDISVYNVPGFMIKKVKKGYLSAGLHKIRFNIHHTGSFILSLNCNCRRYSTKFNIAL